MDWLQAQRVEWQDPFTREWNFAVELPLANGGKFLISLKANCIDSTNEPDVVFANEVNKLKDYGLTPKEQLTLEPYERDHAMILGTYR